MLIAVTRSDEVNMVACQVAYSLFNVRRRIARIRHRGYLEAIWRGLYADDQLPTNVVISPELEVANGIIHRLRAPGAFDMVPLANGKVQLLGIHCTTSSCPMTGTRMDQLLDSMRDAGFVAIAIIRGGRAFIPQGQDRVECGDSVYVIAEPSRVDRVMAAFGHHKQVARRLVIVGGGDVGISLAQRLQREASLLSLKVIERSKDRAAYISQQLGEGTVVLHGDALDKEVLREADVASAEAIVAVTNDDETNIFASVLAKREGCGQAITLVNKTSYKPMMPVLGIDSVVSPSTITISIILRHVRQGPISALHTLHEDFGEVIEAKALAGSRLVSGSLRDVGMPDGMLIGAVVRNGGVIIPTGATRIQPGDCVIAMVTYQALRKGEAMLSDGRKAPLLGH